MEHWSTVQKNTTLFFTIKLTEAKKYHLFIQNNTLKYYYLQCTGTWQATEITIQFTFYFPKGKSVIASTRTLLWFMTQVSFACWWWMEVLDLTRGHLPLWGRRLGLRKLNVSPLDEWGDGAFSHTKDVSASLISMARL